jgi:hypothetical protein
MKSPALSLLLFLLTITLQLNAQQERTFNVNPGGKLELELNFGDIIIETWNKNEVIIRGEEDESGKLDISQSGSSIKVKSRYSQDIRVKMPEEFSVSLSSSGGDIIVKGNLTGKFSSSTAAGSIIFENINGDLTVNSGGGDIKGKNISGKTTANTAGGDIVLGTVNGEMKINTAGGDIKIERMLKDASINTGGGNITLGSLEGKGSVRTGGGDIEIRSAAKGINVVTGGGNLILPDSKGDVKVVSGGGDIKLNNTSGNIILTTGSGNVTAELSPAGSGKNIITNGSGDVKLVIPENTRTTVRVITKDRKKNSTEVYSDFNRTSNEIKDHEEISTYEINGGGSIIEIRLGDGRIEISKKK